MFLRVIRMVMFPACSGQVKRLKQCSSGVRTQAHCLELRELEKLIPLYSRVLAPEGSRRHISRARGCNAPRPRRAPPRGWQPNSRPS